MLVQSREQFDSAMDVLKVASRITFDTETNGLHVHKGHRLCGIAAYVELHAPYAIGFYFPFRHALGDNLFNVSENLPLKWLKPLGEIFARSDLMTEWCNYKFDAKMLRAEDIEIVGPFFDVMVASVLVDENMDHSLEGLELKYLGTETKKEIAAKHLKPYLKGKKDYSKVPPAEMEFYAVNDVRATRLVVNPLKEELKAQEQLGLWPDCETFLRQLFEMEWTGIPIDRELASQLSESTEARMRELEDAMGFDPQKRAVLADRLFSQPPDGLGLPASTRTTSQTSPQFPQGLPGMDSEELLALIDHDPTCDEEAARANQLVSNVLEYRGLVKANSTWYRGFLDGCGSDGNIHPTYNTAGDRDRYGTVTTRLTCAGPNIQQLPRDPRRKVYKLLLPDSQEMDFGGLLKRVCRHRLYIVDYSQIEYRLGSVYADETDVLEMYRVGGDVHQLIANKLGIPRNDPEGKVDGKKVNFTCYYGAAGDTIATLLKIPEADGYVLHKEYWAALPKTRQFVFACTRAAKQKGYVRLWNGRRRHFRYAWEHHKAFNSIIQGGAAQIMERSMVEFHCRKAPYRVALQIHDALGIMVPDDFREHWLEEIREIMEWPTREFPIAFPVEFKNIHADKENHICTPDCFTEPWTQEQTPDTPSTLVIA